MFLDRFASSLDGAVEQHSGTGLSRRMFIKTGAAAGGGLLLSLSLPGLSRATATADAGDWVPNAFVRIGRDGPIVLTMPYVEMGQGTYTSIPMLIAEELEVDLKQVELEHAPPNEKLYANPLLGVQATGNSNAIRGAWQPLRQAGAIARTLLVSAAAKRWNVDPASCRAQSGEVLHAPTGRSTNLANLPPTPPACLSPKAWRSNDRRISSSSAHRPSGWMRRRRSTERLSMASTFGRRA
jgi:isoquinoline 1-oxidoreductase subunit beta